MTGVSYMIPFVAAGGLLIAWDSSSAGMRLPRTAWILPCTTPSTTCQRQPPML